MIFHRTKLLLSLVLVIVACSSMVSSKRRNYSGANICVISTSSCSTNSTSVICGRYGRSNLCKRFSNSCDLQMSSCGSSGAKYKQVSSTYCSGIAVNQRRRCNGLSSSSSSILSSLFGSNSNSNSNVTPIIIRT